MADQNVNDYDINETNFIPFVKNINTYDPNQQNLIPNIMEAMHNIFFIPDQQKRIMFSWLYLYCMKVKINNDNQCNPPRTKTWYPENEVPSWDELQPYITALYKEK